MEQRIYTFARLRKRKPKNNSIFQSVSKRKLPEINVKSSKAIKVQSIISNYGNISSPYIVTRRKSPVPSATPTLRSASSKAQKMMKIPTREFSRHTPPPVVKNINIRYLNQDLEDIDSQNVMETPEDTIKHSDSREVFHKMIPNCFDLLENFGDLQRHECNKERRFEFRKEIVASTRCGSKPSIVGLSN